MSSSSFSSQPSACRFHQKPQILHRFNEHKNTLDQILSVICFVGGFRDGEAAVCLWARGPSAPQSEEEGVAALGAVHRVVLIVEVQDVLLRFEAKLLVEQHGRVTGRHVQRHVLPHARLSGGTGSERGGQEVSALAGQRPARAK